MNSDILSYIISYIDIDKVYHLLAICGHRYYKSIKYVYDKIYMHMTSHTISHCDTYSGDHEYLHEESRMRYYTYGNVAIPLTSIYKYIMHNLCTNESHREYICTDNYYISSRVEEYNKHLIHNIRDKGYHISYLYCTHKYRFVDLDIDVFKHIISYLDIVYLQYIRSTCKWVYSIYCNRMMDKSYHHIRNLSYVQVENAFSIISSCKDRYRYETIDDLYNIDHYIQCPIHD